MYWAMSLLYVVINNGCVWQSYYRCSPLLCRFPLCHRHSPWVAILPLVSEIPMYIPNTVKEKGIWAALGMQAVFEQDFLKSRSHSSNLFKFYSSYFFFIFLANHCELLIIIYTVAGILKFHSHNTYMSGVKLAASQFVLIKVEEHLI